MTLLEAATWYHKHGFNVLPLKNNRKNPALVGWEKYKNSRVTDEEIRKWFSDSSVTGVILVTGKISGVTVIDDDFYVTGNKLPVESTWEVATASGGRHIFYKYSPVPSRNVKTLEYEYEVHNEGRLTVLPPSKALNKTGEIGEYTWSKRGNKFEFPEYPESKLPEKIEVTNQVKINELLEVEHGQQHFSMLKLMEKLLFGSDSNSWESVIKPLVRKAGEDYKKDGLPYPYRNDLFEHDWEDAKKFVIAQKIKRQALDESKQEATATRYSQMTDSELSTIIPRETMPVGLKNLDSIFKFPAGYYVICANPGTGKGWFALWLIRRFWESYNHKSVFFSLEMGEQLVRRRMLQAWSDINKDQLESGADTTKAKTLLKQDITIIDEFSQNAPESQTPEYFMEKFEAYYSEGYRVFLFDHLHELIGATDNDSNQKVTAEWGLCFQNICKKYQDIWFVVFSQPNAGAAAKDYIRREDMLGSKAISYKCDYFISLNRKRQKLDPYSLEAQSIDEDRNVLFWLDKARENTEQHVGRVIYFSKTGNYFESETDERYQLTKRPHEDYFVSNIKESLF